MYVYFSVMMAQKKLLQLNFSIEELDEVMTEERMKPVTFFSSPHCSYTCHSFIYTLLFHITHYVKSKVLIVTAEKYSDS